MKAAQKQSSPKSGASRKVPMAKTHETPGHESPTHEPTSLATMACCPQLEPCQVCDELDIRYRLPFRRTVRQGDRQQIITVLVTLHFRFRRCAGPLSLGDL